MPLQVKVVAAAREVWSGEASTVLVRTADGDMGILPGHTPVLALLVPGDLRVTPVTGEVVVASVQEGFLSVEHDHVTVVSGSVAVAPERPGR